MTRLVAGGSLVLIGLWAVPEEKQAGVCLLLSLVVVVGFRLAQRWREWNMRRRYW